MKTKLLLLCCLCIMTQLVVAQIAAGSLAQYNFSENLEDNLGGPDMITKASSTTLFNTSDPANSCAVNIPDANFKTALLGDTSINTNGDTEIHCAEASAFTGTMNVFAFSNSNQISSIDFSANTALFNIVSNEASQLTSVTLGSKPNLERLTLTNNSLATIDLSGATALKVLEIAQSNLATIDLSNQSNLESIRLANNNLSAIDVSSNLVVEDIQLSNNNLTSFDITNNPLVDFLFVINNDLTQLDLTNGANTILTSFNATSNPNLTCIKVDTGFTPPSSWSKDATASYSDNCSADTTPPVAVCLDITIPLDANGNATLTAAQIDGGSSDAEGAVTLSIDSSTLSCSDIGSNAVTLTVTDTAGNADTCTATVTIVDTINPTISCLADFSTSAVAGTQYVLPDFIAQGDVTATDNCEVTITTNIPAGTALNFGTTTVRFTATDSSGNTDICDVRITVDEEADTVSPTAVCTVATISLDTDGNATIVAQQLDGGSSDNVGIDTFSIDVSTFDCSNLGANTIILTVTDAAGNSDNCSTTVTVIDTIDPTISCPVDEAVSIQQGAQYVLPDYVAQGLATSQDNCGTMITQNPVVGTQVGGGVATITFTATDVSGNTAICSFDLTVDDTLSLDGVAVVSLLVYPNPVQDFLFIESSTPVKNVSVYSISGKRVQDSVTDKVDMSSLAKGVYFLQIQTQAGITVKR